jgi:RES domain-containing protein
VALDIDSVTVEGAWVRHVPAGVDPAGRPHPPADNRWQRGRAVDALYLADSASCAWAEWYRHLAEASIPPNFALPRDLWRYDVQPIEVADLSDPDRLARVGLARPRPGRRNWPSCQAVGEQLHDEGWRGLLAPSAARPDSRVLVVFLPDATIPVQLVAVGHTRIAEPPAPPTGMQT